MPKLKIISQTPEKTTYSFQCPGCHDTHHVAVPGWTFNGDLEKPTFSPSLLVRCGHYAPHHNDEDSSCWCTYNAENPTEPAPFICYQCHSFVKEGKIEFCSDCSHDLAGQTVELPTI